MLQLSFGLLTPLICNKLVLANRSQIAESGGIHERAVGSPKKAVEKSLLNSLQGRATPVNGNVWGHFLFTHRWKYFDGFRDLKPLPLS